MTETLTTTAPESPQISPEQGVEEPITLAEELALTHFGAEITLKDAVAQVDFAALTDPIPGYSGSQNFAEIRIQTMINDKITMFNMALQDNNPAATALEKQIILLQEYVHDRYTEPVKSETVDGSTIDAYMNASRLGDDSPEVQAAGVSIANRVHEMSRDASALQLIAADQAENRQQEAVANDQQEVVEIEDTPEIIAAREKLTGYRTQLAKTYARRESKLLGADLEGSQNRKVKDLRAQYEKASQDLFKLTHGEMLADPSITVEDKLLELATFTVDQGRELELEKIAHYENSRFGKIAKFISANTTRKLIVGGLISIASSTVTAGWGTGLGSGLMMAATLETKHREARKNESSVLDDVDDMYDHLSDFTYDATIHNDADVLISAAMNKNHKAFDKKVKSEQKRRLAVTAGSIAVGVSIGAAMHGIIGNGVFGGGGHEATQAAAPLSPHDIVPPTDHSAALNLDPSHHIAEAYNGPSDIMVNPGEGFNSVFNQMNIPQDQWADILHKVGPELVQHGDAYWMPDGTAGIASPGMMSQHAMQLIMNARG